MTMTQRVRIWAQRVGKIARILLRGWGAYRMLLLALAGPTESLLSLSYKVG